MKGARAKKNMKVKEGNKGYKEENEEQKKHEKRNVIKLR